MAKKPEKQKKVKEEWEEKEESAREVKEEEYEEEQEKQKAIEEKAEEVVAETLEEIAEAPQPQTIEAEDFSEFMLSSEPPVSEISAQMPSPTLPFTIPETMPEPTEPENLEEIGAASSIGTPIPTAPGGEPEYIRVYNEPEYVEGTSEESILKDMGERGMMGRTAEELRRVQPRAMIEEWHEIEEARERTGTAVEDYVVVEAGRREEERRLPFEQQRKYKELKRRK